MKPDPAALRWAEHERARGEARRAAARALPLLAWDTARALERAEQALDRAQREGRRTDCLRVAVEALEGALRNVRWEDNGCPGPEVPQ